MPDDASWLGRLLPKTSAISSWAQPSTQCSQTTILVSRRRHQGDLSFRWQWLINFSYSSQKCMVLTQLTDLCEYVNERIQSHFFGERAIRKDPEGQ